MYVCIERGVRIELRSHAGSDVLERSPELAIVPRSTALLSPISNRVISRHDITFVQKDVNFCLEQGRHGWD